MFDQFEERVSSGLYRHRSRTTYTTEPPRSDYQRSTTSRHTSFLIPCPNQNPRNTMELAWKLFSLKTGPAFRSWLLQVYHLLPELKNVDLPSGDLCGNSIVDSYQPQRPSTPSTTSMCVPSALICFLPVNKTKLQRTGMTAARLKGFEQDLGLSGTSSEAWSNRRT